MDAAPYHYPFYLGGVSSTIAACITHPIDSCKIKTQVQATRRGMWQTMVWSYQRPGGGLLHLWDGVSATVLRGTTYAMTRFGVYATLKEQLAAHQLRIADSHGAVVPGWQLIGCGVIAGGMAGFLGVPAEVVLVRMCSEVVKPPNQQLHYRNAADGLMKVYRNEGFSKLYRGWKMVVVRCMVMNGTQLSSYDVIKRRLLASGTILDNTPGHLLTAFGAGTIAVTACAPLDLIKSRIQNSTGPSPNPLVLLRDAIRSEGIRFLGRGFIPAWSRLMPTMLLTFVFLEQAKKAVDHMRVEGGESIEVIKRTEGR